MQSWLSISRVKPRWPTRQYRDTDQEVSRITLCPNLFRFSTLLFILFKQLQMVESCLVFLVSLLTLRTNLGLSEEVLTRLEMVSLLCMSDKTHSMLFEHMPEKCGATVPLELFDKVLSEVAQYSEPRFEGGNMQQGMYLPRPSVWEDLYDPIYVQLRAVHRREFQTSIERFSSL